MSLSAFSYARDTDGNWPGVEGTGVKGLPGTLSPTLWSSPHCRWAGIGLRLGGRTCSDHTATPAWDSLSLAGPCQKCWHVHSTSVLVSIPIRISAFIPTVACSPSPSFLPPPLPRLFLSLCFLSGVLWSWPLSVAHSVSLSLSMISFSMTVSAFVSLCPISISVSLSLFLCVPSVSLCPPHLLPHLCVTRQ